MSKFNGHKNWNHWNISLWINNDEGLYRMALARIRGCRHHGGRARAAEVMLEDLQESNLTKTPDGAPYTVTSIRAAMVGLE